MLPKCISGMGFRFPQNSLISKRCSQNVTIVLKFKFCRKCSSSWCASQFIGSKCFYEWMMAANISFTKTAFAWEAHISSFVLDVYNQVTDTPLPRCWQRIGQCRTVRLFVIFPLACQSTHQTPHLTLALSFTRSSGRKHGSTASSLKVWMLTM